MADSKSIETKATRDGICDRVLNYDSTPLYPYTTLDCLLSPDETDNDTGIDLIKKKVFAMDSPDSTALNGARLLAFKTGGENGYNLVPITDGFISDENDETHPDLVYLGKDAKFHPFTLEDNNILNDVNLNSYIGTSLSTAWIQKPAVSFASNNTQNFNLFFDSDCFEVVGGHLSVKHATGDLNTNSTAYQSLDDNINYLYTQLNNVGSDASNTNVPICIGMSNSKPVISPVSNYIADGAKGIIYWPTTDGGHVDGTYIDTNGVQLKSICGFKEPSTTTQPGFATPSEQAYSLPAMNSGEYVLSSYRGYIKWKETSTLNEITIYAPGHTPEETAEETDSIDKSYYLVGTRTLPKDVQSSPGRVSGLVKAEYYDSDNLSASVTATIFFKNGTLYNTSDERLKVFTDNLKIDLDKLSEIKKDTFYWKADAGKKENIGVSAQSVENLFPQIVTEDGGYKHVSYEKLSVVALAAIDELHKENLQLKKELDELKKKVK